MHQRLDATLRETLDALTSHSSQMSERLDASVGENARRPLTSHSETMSERMEATAQHSVVALAGHTETLQSRLAATLGETLGVLSGYSEQLSGAPRLDSAAISCRLHRPIRAVCRSG